MADTPLPSCWEEGPLEPSGVRSLLSRYGAGGARSCGQPARVCAGVLQHRLPCVPAALREGELQQCGDWPRATHLPRGEATWMSERAESREQGKRKAEEPHGQKDSSVFPRLVSAWLFYARVRSCCCGAVAAVRCGAYCLLYSIDMNSSSRITLVK